MSLIERIRCWFGTCSKPFVHESEALTQMRTNVADTAELKRATRQLKETGIWPRDMVVGSYQPSRDENDDRV
jgi:hypothetical protein